MWVLGWGALQHSRRALGWLLCPVLVCCGCLQLVSWDARAGLFAAPSLGTLRPSRACESHWHRSVFTDRTDQLFVVLMMCCHTTARTPRERCAPTCSSFCSAFANDMDDTLSHTIPAS